jgi:hypothetical protein
MPDRRDNNTIVRPNVTYLMIRIKKSAKRILKVLVTLVYS